MSLAEKKAEKLHAKFKELDLLTGKVTANELVAWFVSNSEQNTKLPDWFCASITKANIIDAKLNESYERVLPKNYSSSDFEQALQSTTKKYPGIFDLEENKLDIELLKDELSMYEADLKHLNEIIVLNEEQSIDIKRVIAISGKNEFEASCGEQKALENCSKWAKSLDKVNEEIYDEIKSFSFDFLNTENSKRYLFEDIKSHQDFCDNIQSTLEEVINKGLKHHPVLQSLLLDSESKYELNLNQLIVNDKLEALQLKINNSLSKRGHAEAHEEASRIILEKLDQLNGVDIYSAVTNLNQTNNLNRQFDEEIRKNLLSKQLSFEEVATKCSKQQVNLVKTAIVQQKINQDKNILELFKNAENHLRNVISFQNVLKLLISAESQNLLESLKDCKDIHKYVTEDLRNCAIRIKKMQRTTKEDKFDKETIELNWCQSFHDFAEIISPENTKVSFEEAIFKLLNLQESCQDLQDHLFVDDINDFRNRCTHLENDVTVLKTFLKSRCTEELNAIPFSIFELLQNADAECKALDASLATLLSTMNETTAKIAQNKWLKYKRRLWMFFLVSPSMMVEMIEEIKSETSNKLAQYFN